MQKRELSYDLLRITGILVIMIAHADPPPWLFQLRNFGTPLLIITSALTHEYIFRERTLKILPFYRKRMGRLVIPAWIFLTFFFLLYLLFSKMVQEEFPFSLRTMILSYTFYSGIGFVWIFKVYLILGIVTPLALYMNGKLGGGSKFYLLLLLIYLPYEIAVHLTTAGIPEHWKEAYRQLFTLIPYVLLFLYGMRLHTFSDRKVFVIALFSLLLCGLLGIRLYLKNQGFVETNLYKDPPRMYYLAYAFFAIHILYLLARRHANRFKQERIVWLSKHAMWIYLWHILGYYIMGHEIRVLEISIGNPLLLSFLKALFLIGFSLALTALQSSLVDRYMKNSRSGFARNLARYL